MKALQVPVLICGGLSHRRVVSAAPLAPSLHGVSSGRHGPAPWGPCDGSDLDP
jgi:hypothetical protein